MIALRSSLLVLAAAIAGSAADSEIDQLLQKTRAKVLDTTQRLPRYACGEAVSRAQYNRPPGHASACSRQAGVRGSLMMQDRLRLDVAVVAGKEMFSWAGAPRFETGNMAQFVSAGAATSADFGTFLRGVFGGEPETIRYLGVRDRFALFEYAVPVARSTYTYSIDPARAARKTGYRGTFLVDPSDGDLRRLVIETDEFEHGDGVCRVEHVMDYQRVKIGDGDFLLPEVSTMTALYLSGIEMVDEARYSGCREYTGESTVRFDNALPAAAPVPVPVTPPAPLPHGTRMRIALDKPIDTEVAAAGDEVTGVCTFGGETARVRGRILRFGQFMTPRPHWIMALRFDTIVRSAVTQPISLQPIDGGRPPPSGALPQDAGIFHFEGSGQIDFRSLWETR